MSPTLLSFTTPAIGEGEGVDSYGNPNGCYFQRNLGLYQGERPKQV